MNFLENKIIILGCFVVLFLIIGCLSFTTYYFYSDDCEECVPCGLVSLVEDEKSNEEATKDNKFFVEIKGEVVNPGVYECEDGNIINDLILKAGGFKKNAYSNNINLSKRLESEMVINVFTKYEYSKSKKLVTETKTEVCKSEKEKIDNCTDDFVSVIVSGENNDKSDSVQNKTDEKKSDVIDSKININNAGVSELSTLPGLGEKKAQAIISYREENGLFKTIEDIKNVSGIGDATYEKFKELITV